MAFTPAGFPSSLPGTKPLLHRHGGGDPPLPHASSGLNQCKAGSAKVRENRSDVVTGGTGDPGQAVASYEIRTPGPARR